MAGVSRAVCHILVLVTLKKNRVYVRGGNTHQYGSRCLFTASPLVSRLVAKFTLFFENSDSFGEPGYRLARERDRRTVAARFVIST